jgi:YcaO-like protein with predicted kinase domain
MKWRWRKVPGSHDRTVPPEVTVERLLAVREKFGITRVADATGLDVYGIPVHTTVTPRSVSSSTVSSGKGLSAAESLAGALAEAIEVDCAERHQPKDLLTGTARELAKTYRVYTPHLGLPGRFRFPDDEELEWVWVEGLGRAEGDRRGLLPRDFVRQGSHGHGGGKLFPEMLSNGLASGNIPEEGIAHALGELIERDAESIFTFRAKYLAEPIHRSYSRIDLSTLPEVPRRLVDRVAEAGRRLTLIDVTTDVEIAAVLCEVDGASGAAAAASAEVAVVRAITEAIQTSTINIQGSREDLDPGARDPRIHQGNFGLDVPEVRRLLDDRSLPETSFAALPSKTSLFVDEDVSHLVSRLTAVGFRDIFVCDLTHPDCQDFHVVRVVVPGLESGRLDNMGPRRLRYALTASS